MPVGRCVQTDLGKRASNNTQVSIFARAEVLGFYANAFAHAHATLHSEHTRTCAQNDDKVEPALREEIA